MGFLSRRGTAGPPKELMLALRSKFGISDFVETGTFRGDTAAWASHHFDRVVTVEFSQVLFDAARRRLAAEAPKVEVMFGHSVNVLKEMAPRLGHRTLFWLDSHWSGGQTFGSEQECPLIAEIQCLDRAPEAPFLLIDDARLFLAPPPRPHRREQWPDLLQVAAALSVSRHRYFVAVFGDVILAVPEQAKDFVATYLQDVATREWQHSNGGRVRRWLRGAMRR